MSNNSPSMQPLKFSDNTGDSWIQRLAGILQISDDGGNTWIQPGSGGGFTPKQGANLGDASVTIQPFTDKASQYVLPGPTTLTTNRSDTLGTTSIVTGTLVRIVRKDTTANTLAIVNGGTNAGTLFTFLGSQTENRAATFQFNGVDWIYVGFEYLN